MKKITAYLQAGLDESFAQFGKHMLGAVIITVIDYTYRHMTKESTISITALTPFLLGIPGLPALIKWLVTLPQKDAAVAPLSTEFAGTIPQG